MEPTNFYSALTAVFGTSGAVVIVIGWKIWRVLSQIESRLIQHDMMWSDYCTAHNIPNINLTKG